MTSGISVAEARYLLDVEGPELYELLSRAGQTKLRHRGDSVDPCAIVNAKSGNCSQNCAFCAQSSRSEAAIERYGLLPAEALFDAARAAAEAGAARFSIVTSGRTVRTPAELRTIAQVIERIARELPVTPCASLGLLDAEALVRLRDAGLTRYHHNLESAESFWPSICTTRSWRRSLDTNTTAKELGLSVCCGGIFGLGESRTQRIELLEAIRDLEADSAPLNFLHPIPGTPLEGLRELTPLDCLKVVAVARLMMPEREVRICGGREHNLRDLQSWLLLAGADGIMVGGYLTTRGRTIADDLQMIRDAGLRLTSRVDGSGHERE